MESAENKYDAALGSLLGAFVGDAAGATLEFMELITPADLQRALEMRGGGIWQTAPGQITDDGEMALCLAHGLAQSPRFDLEAIARQYVRWVESHPFDIGNTTRNGLSAYQHHDCDRQQPADCMTRAARRLNMGSKANGSLMRAAPLGIWGAAIEDGQLAACAQQESSLTHPNESCWQAVACYVIAIAVLLRQPGDRQGAFNRAQTWAAANANEEVRDWLTLAGNDVPVPYAPLIGFVKIGFVHAFRHLRRGTPFSAAIAETLAGGGDTDTNACIVGGLVGAAAGAGAIPPHQGNAVLQCDTINGRERPSFLHCTTLPELVDKLLDISSS